MSTDLQSKKDQLATRLETIIHQKNIQPGEMIWSESQLIARFGASRSTVRRALQSLEDRGIIARRKGKGAFVADRAPLRPGVHRPPDAPASGFDLALVLPNFDDLYHASIAESAAAVFHRNGHRTRIVPGVQRDEFLRHIDEQRVDGALLSLPDIDCERRMPAEFLPRVVLVDEGGPPKWNQVACDDVAGGAMATAYLISLGHRTIFHISGALHMHNGLDRLEGYRKTMREAGLGSRIAYDVGFYHEAGGYEKMNALLARHGVPEAVFCGNDRMAVGAARALDEAGLRVPDDVSLVGYGNQVEGMRLTPRLTSVDQGPRAIGAVAARLLLAMLQGDPSRPETVKLPPGMMFRQSCRPRPPA